MYIMEQKLESKTTSIFRIHPATLPDHIHLNVNDLQREIDFYQKVIGLQLLWTEGDSAGLGAGGRDVVRLSQLRNATRARGTTGLYHFAILLPNQRELARVIRRLIALRYTNYPTDHVMTKTTYLDDPEGNGIELYAESPEDGSWSMQNGDYITRRKNGSLSSGRDPLDLDALFQHLQPDDRIDEPMPAETRIGHFHLHVGHLQESVQFYHEVLGFDEMGMDANIRMGMVSAGGYHHHIGLNTWKGVGAPPPPDGSLGLRYISFRLPDETALNDLVAHVKKAGVKMQPTDKGFEVLDPSRNRIIFSVKKDASQ